MSAFWHGQQAFSPSKDSWLLTPATVDGVDKEGVRKLDFAYLVRYHYLVGNTKYDGKDRLFLEDYEPKEDPISSLSFQYRRDREYAAYPIREKSVSALRNGSCTVYVNQSKPQESAIFRRKASGFNLLGAGLFLVLGGYFFYTACRQGFGGLSRRDALSTESDSFGQTSKGN